MLKTFVLLPVLATVALGSMAPRFYRENQLRAPEQVQIELLHVRQSRQDGPRIGVTMRARVVSVQRTKTQLRSGDLISVEYSTEVPDPSRRSVSCASNPIPIPAQGARTTAFLHRRDAAKVYGPAAGHVSFSPLISE